MASIPTKTPAATKTPRLTRTGRSAAPTGRPEERTGGGMREEVAAYRRDLILNAAITIFYEHGYHESTVDMLAEQLSGSKAIVYYHFPDKQAILEEIFRRALTAAQALIQRAIDTPGAPPDRLIAFARNYAEWVIDNQLTVGIFWREERSLSKSARAAVAVEQKKMDDMVARIIREGVASGHFTVIDINATARSISGVISFLYTWWRPEKRLSRTAAGDYYADLALRMAGMPVVPDK